MIDGTSELEPSVSNIRGARCGLIIQTIYLFFFSFTDRVYVEFNFYGAQVMSTQFKGVHSYLFLLVIFMYQLLNERKP